MVKKDQVCHIWFLLEAWIGFEVQWVSFQCQKFISTRVSIPMFFQSFSLVVLPPINADQDTCSRERYIV